MNTIMINATTFEPTKIFVVSSLTEETVPAKLLESPKCVIQDTKESGTSFKQPTTQEEINNFIKEKYDKMISSMMFSSPHALSVSVRSLIIDEIDYCSRMQFLSKSSAECRKMEMTRIALKNELFRRGW